MMEPKDNASWKVNAYCPHGLVRSVELDIDGRFVFPDPCCEVVSRAPSKFAVWRETRRFRRQMRRLREWVDGS